MKKSQNLINWVELSRLLANNSTSISKKRIPKKYQKDVNDLLSCIEAWEKNIKTVDLEQTTGEETQT